MLTTAQRATNPAPATPLSPRLTLARIRASTAVLDGGWWPRSRDPVAELPGLVLALSDRYGTIRQLMFNSTAWDSRFQRLAVGGTVVRAGWFTSVDPALLIATTDRGDQIDLLMVPARTDAATADAAMTMAADPTSVRRAPAILAAVSAASAS